MNYVTAMLELGINSAMYMLADCIRQQDYDSAKDIISANSMTKADLDVLFNKKVLTSIAPSGYDLSKMRTTEKFDAFFNTDDESSEKFD